MGCVYVEDLDWQVLSSLLLVIFEMRDEERGGLYRRLG